MKKTQNEVVIFGATSFVGQILCRVLLGRHGAGGEFRWALAGRSREKLEKLRRDLGPGADRLPLVVADAADEAALAAMCASTRVVVSTVGPYALYGSPLVKVCAESGTDYCDLTGEVQWISRMIAQHEEAARRSGARLVHCCGVDSIPSDLGVHFLQQQARARFGKTCVKVRLGVRGMRGGLSGGTAASMLNGVRESVADPAVRKLMGNPYAICPGVGGVRQPNVTFAEYDAERGTWLAPFVMAVINTRVVHRSNALAGNPYGADFTYDEATMTGKGLRGALLAAATGAGLAAFVVAAAAPPTRWLLARFVVPKPGEGPSPEAQERGSFDLRLVGTTAAGERLTVKVTGDRDPGYGSTGKMLGEAALCLARSVPETPGGFWTPATIFGDRLIGPLTEHAGITFQVLD